MNKEEIIDRLYELNIHADITVEDLADEISEMCQQSRQTAINEFVDELEYRLKCNDWIATEDMIDRIAEIEKR